MRSRCVAAARYERGGEVRLQMVTGLIYTGEIDREDDDLVVIKVKDGTEHLVFINPAHIMTAQPV